MEARQKGIPGLAPKEIREYVQKVHKRTIGAPINTVASRMWRELGQLDKCEETGLFSIPDKEKPAGVNLFEPISPAGSLFQPAKGREAVPGGGT